MANKSEALAVDAAYQDEIHSLVMLVKTVISNDKRVCLFVVATFFNWRKVIMATHPKEGVGYVCVCSD